MPPAMAPRVRGSVQPQAVALEIADQEGDQADGEADRPEAVEPAGRGVATCGTRKYADATTTAASAAATQNSACQSQFWATNAASGSPIAPPTPRVALIAAIAVPVRRGGVISRISEMPTGMKPMDSPWSARPDEHRRQRVGERADHRGHEQQRRAGDQHPLLAEQVGQPSGGRHRDAARRAG